MTPKASPLSHEHLKNYSILELEELLKITKSNLELILTSINRLQPSWWDVKYNMYRRSHGNTSCMDDSENEWIRYEPPRDENEAKTSWIGDTHYFVKECVKSVKMYIPLEHLDDYNVVKDEYLSVFDTQSQVCNCIPDEYGIIYVTIKACRYVREAGWYDE